MKCYDLLNARSHKVNCTLQHPDNKLNLTNGVSGILTTRNHVKGWFAFDVVAEDDLLACNSLEIS